MEEFLQNLYGGLKYISHEHVGDAVKIACRMERGTAVCPYCGKPSNKVNRKYKRVLKDVPFGDKKVVLTIYFNNYFCRNDECKHFSFAEHVEFAEPFATRTKRLDGRILELAAKTSAVGSERYLRRNIADVSANTVNRVIKKNAENKTQLKTHRG
jgi:transposase